VVEVFGGYIKMKDLQFVVFNHKAELIKERSNNAITTKKVGI